MEARFGQTLDDYGGWCSLLYHKTPYDTNERNTKANVMLVFVYTRGSCYSARQLIKRRHYIYIFTYFEFDIQVSTYIDIKVDHMSHRQRA
jgi:hypothetical protein